MRRLVWFGAVAALLAGCSAPGGSVEDKPGPVPDPADRSRAVADAWDGSPAARAWREGFYPLEPLTRLPEDAWHSGADKEAWLGHRVVWRSNTIAEIPSTAPVKWADGKTLDLRLLDPRQALPMDPAAEQGGEGPPPLKITAWRHGSLDMVTSRGRATVPAWLYTVEGYATPVARVAVAESAPPKNPIGPREEIAPDLSLEGVSADGTVLTLKAGHGACDAGAKVDVLESAETVVLAGSVKPGPDPGAPCTAQLLMQTVTVRLGRPLAARVPVDALTGGPVMFQGRQRETGD
ncbi:hypothetical protein [Streptomyces sp. NPDC101132]|uniref:hypothetical protein n=1 Tax=Streptomyces sp. NPDC101132 TaxID=3366110 RepID=UPI00381C7BCD